MTTAPVSTSVGDTLRIRGVDVPVRTTELPQADLRFYVDNPRIYSVVRGDDKEPSQEDIERKLLELEHVKELIHDIRRNDGLTDSVVVRAGGLEVLEGNSRLAAYRALAKIDPVKWGRMKCKLLPEDIDERLIFALLGQYHIKGKKDWAPFEQAGFLYRRAAIHNIDAAQLAAEIGLSRHKVEHLIATHRFMLDYEETDTARWSYYDEYLKSRAIRKARYEYPGFDDLVVEKIKSGEISRAVDVRNRLPVVCSVPRVLKKFAKETHGFEEAYEQAIDAGADSTPYKRLAAFRQWLAKPEVAETLARTQGETRKKIEFELNRLTRRVEAVRDKLRPKE